MKKQEKDEEHKFNNDSIYKANRKNQSEIGALEEVMVKGER